MKGKIKLFLVWFFAVILVPVIGLNSCKINYSFTGANISADVKTYSVYYFPNRARLVNPTLSADFTEKLKEKLLRQTSLKEEAENGDLVYADYRLRGSSHGYTKGGSGCPKQADGYR